MAILNQGHIVQNTATIRSRSGHRSTAIFVNAFVHKRKIAAMVASSLCVFDWIFALEE